MPRILFVAAHRPDRSPGQRFRFEQYLPFLRRSGFECDFSYLISENDDRFYYGPGNRLKKLWILTRSAWKRLGDVRSVSDYDVVFVHRQAFMTGSVFFERRFSRSKAKLVFDFDDALWQLDVSDANKSLRWLKRPSKIPEIIKMSDWVVAGNRYLGDYARQFNDRLSIIPTTIDTDEYQPRQTLSEDRPVCVGWSGSLTTIKHFALARPYLERVKRKYGPRVTFKVVGDSGYVDRDLDIRGIAWRKEDELEELLSFDIGIMPLPDDEWAKGKCGLKGLQYMALGKPAVMSRVGVNKEIIDDGRNGFLADGPEDWVDKLSQLIDSKERRETMGKAGRATVVDRYSVVSQAGSYLALFESLSHR